MQIYLHIFFFYFFAEGEGFEPSERYKRSTVFKTAAIDHSANPPKYLVGLKGLEPIRLSALAPKASVATITPQSEN